MEKLAYHIDEAVEVSGVGRTKMYAFIKTGKLKSRKVGKRRIVLADDLKAMLEDLPEQAT